MTMVYLVRHGETDYNKMGCYYGWTDCSLAQSGIEQSQALRKVFENIHYDVMVSSDLKRAVETANIINSPNKILTDKRLRELNFGQWEGKSYEEIAVEYTEHWNLWIEDFENATPTDGESLAGMYNRICDYMDEILSLYKNKSIVIVSHNGSLRIIAAYLLGLGLEKIWSFSFDHGKYSLLEMNEGHCTIKGINNI
ncbi:MAG: putative phosphoglycerate mutase family protein [Clostridia bacterium]|jgi:alpha-ribazole phosphatase|nr:putative phosphoglycerate mutase family protein [Clostridia bacterium]